MTIEIPRSLYRRVAAIGGRPPIELVVQALESFVAFRTAPRRHRSGPARFGFKRIPGGGVAPVAREQIVVDVIRRQRAEHRTYREIATELEARDLRPRGGGRWHHEQVRRIHERANSPQ